MRGNGGAICIFILVGCGYIKTGVMLPAVWAWYGWQILLLRLFRDAFVLGGGVAFHVDAMHAYARLWGVGGSIW